MIKEDETKFFAIDFDGTIAQGQLHNTISNVANAKGHKIDPEDQWNVEKVY